MEHQIITAQVVQGHRVASGLNGDERFPGGTLRMQAPYFHSRGLQTSHLHLGTVNVSVAPLRYRVVKPSYNFTNVKWHPTEPPEDFSFFDVELLQPGQAPLAGFIYYPHPDTKPEHFQRSDVIELWLPFVHGLNYGMELQLRISLSQMTFE
ncbi:MAG TPA: hypothetical protein VG938_09825 [Verrucomicrobiae bacterium]|jgi:hypothetical protein|nr:hypothetical protein [Verrucomicrobiae bacterium]